MPDKFPPSEKIALFDKLISTIPEIERKGKTMPYTSHNGNMFSFLGKDGSMGLRLGKEERNEFLQKHKMELYVSYGAVMKEYVTVPDHLLEDTDAMKPYLEMSYAYVKTLKPKPTKRK